MSVKVGVIRSTLAGYPHMSTNEETHVTSVPFCLRGNVFLSNTETFEEIQIGSVTETGIEINMDMTEDLNQQSIDVVKLEAENIDEAAQSDYTMNACQCNVATFECLTEPISPLKQNSYLNFCVSLTDNDITANAGVRLSSVKSVDLDQGILKVKAVENGVTNSLTSVNVQKENNRAAIESRLISGFFDNDSGGTLEVSGSILLEIVTDSGQRQLVRGNLARSVQQTASATGSFQMNVELDDIGSSSEASSAGTTTVYGGHVSVALVVCCFCTMVMVLSSSGSVV